MINLIVNRSISYVEHVQLIYHKERQALLQTGERITKCVNFITRWGKLNYKLGQLRIVRKGEKILQSRVVYPSQNGAIIIA